MLKSWAAACLLALFVLAPASWSQLAAQALELSHPVDRLRDVPSSRIIGGIEAKARAWPYQAYILVVREVSSDGKITQTSSCGGTVIASTWILTAAHCVVSEGRTWDARRILVQTESKIKLEDGKFNRAKRIIVHDGYPRDGERTVNDIALIELEKPVSAPAVQLADGAVVREVEREGKPATVIGWGRISTTTKETSDWLLQADLEVIGNENCRRIFGQSPLRDLVGPGQICGGDPDLSRGSCNGDSGGPLLSKARDGRYYQIGIVSWGLKDCDPTFSVFSRVSAFMPWIRQYVRLPAPPAPPKPVAQGGDRALLIGIDDYVGESNDLQGSVTDANNMKRLLIDHLGFRGDQIRVLTDAKATRANILRQIDEWLIAGSRSGARVFFYFAGHGYYQPDQNGDESDNVDELLLPHDAASSDGATLDNVIVDDELRQRFNRIADRKVTVVVDSCHAGTMTRAVSLTNDAAFKRMPTRGGFGGQMRGLGVSTRSAQRASAFEPVDDHVTTWTAVSPSQLALVDLEAPEYQGVFTRRFIAGIAQKAADSNHDGKINHAELLDYVTAESEAYCRRNTAQCSLGLTPSLEGRAEVMTTDVITGEHAPSAKDGADGGVNNTNKARLSIAVEPDASRPLDSRIRFRVKSNVSGHFTLFEIGPEDTLTVLLPNPESHIDRYRIESGAAQIVPDSAELGYEWFGVGPPVGSYTLIAVVSEAELDHEALRRQLAGQGAKAFIDSLSQQLRTRWADGTDNVRSPRWSVTSTPYEIVR